MSAPKKFFIPLDATDEELLALADQVIAAQKQEPEATESKRKK